MSFYSNSVLKKATLQNNFLSIIKRELSKWGLYSILQDEHDFIWIGTNGSGLYVYDG